MATGEVAKTATRRSSLPEPECLQVRSGTAPPGLGSANYETAIWRWRTERTIGTDGRVWVIVFASVQHRLRAGVELHYILGPFALSAEYLESHYRGITVYHDLLSGSSREVQERLYSSSGAIRSLSVFAALYLTGEHQRLTNAGWKAAKPRVCLGKGGAGAWELLLRYSLTWTMNPMVRIQLNEVFLWASTSDR